AADARRIGSRARTRRVRRCGGRSRRIGTSANGADEHKGDSVKVRTHFPHSIDLLDNEGEILEHLAGVQDFELAKATYEAALKRWPGMPIMCRQGARVVHDSRKTRLA